ncbi:unnamed protein product, partial [Arctia plantaginis]
NRVSAHNQPYTSYATTPKKLQHPVELDDSNSDRGLTKGAARASAARATALNTTATGGGNEEGGHLTLS